MQVFYGILIPFLGTAFGAACVFFMRKSLSDTVQRSLTGFAAGVMVAASIWSLLIPAIEQSSYIGEMGICPGCGGILDWNIIPVASGSYHSPSAPEKRPCRRTEKPTTTQYDDGVGGDSSQYPGGYGSGCGLCRLSDRQR